MLATRLERPWTSVRRSSRRRSTHGGSNMAGPLGIRRAFTFDYEAAKNVCQRAALKTVSFWHWRSCSAFFGAAGALYWALLIVVSSNSAGMFESQYQRCFFFQSGFSVSRLGWVLPHSTSSESYRSYHFSVFHRLQRLFPLSVVYLPMLVHKNHPHAACVY